MRECVRIRKIGRGMDYENNWGDRSENRKTTKENGETEKNDPKHEECEIRRGERRDSRERVIIAKG